MDNKTLRFMKIVPDTELLVTFMLNVTDSLSPLTFNISVLLFVQNIHGVCDPIPKDLFIE